MAKFNDYSRYMKQVKTIPFEFFGEQFKVKDTQWNLLLIAEAQKATDAASAIEEKLRVKIEKIQEEYGEEIPEHIMAEIEKEQNNITKINLDVNDKVLNCISKILGEKQFERLQELDVSTDGYGVLILIIFGLVSGLSHKQIMEELEKNQGDNMGESVPQKKPQNKKQKK